MNNELELLNNINKMLNKIKDNNIYDIKDLMFKLFDNNKVYRYRYIYKLILEDVLEIILRIDHINYLILHEINKKD